MYFIPTGSLVNGIVSIFTGISMSLLKNNETCGVPSQKFKFEHDNFYREIQRNFIIAVDTLDPNNIVVSQYKSSCIDLTANCHLAQSQSMHSSFFWFLLMMMIIEIGYSPLPSVSYWLTNSIIWHVQAWWGYPSCCWTHWIGYSYDGVSYASTVQHKFTFLSSRV